MSPFHVVRRRASVPQTISPTSIPLSATTPTYGELANPMRGVQSVYTNSPIIDPLDWPYNVSIDRENMYWSNLESTLGVYNFATIDSHLADVQTRKGQFGFRVVSANNFLTGPLVPQYVWNFMVANPQAPSSASLGTQATAPYTYASGGVLTYMPDFDHAYYLSRIQALIQALAGHVTNYPTAGTTLANDPRLGYIDVSPMGMYAEWHVADAPYYTRCDPRGCSFARYAWTIAHGQQIADLWRQSFPAARLVIAPGDPTVASYILGLDTRYSWRFDCIGDGGIANAILTNPFWSTYSNRWLTAPIMAEGCGSATVSALHDETIFFHMSTVDHDLPYSPGYAGYSGADQTTIQQFRKITGYRFQLNSVSAPFVVSRQLSFGISASWSNLGVSPAYTSWSVTFQLRNTSTGAVVWQGVSGLNLQTLSPTTQWSSWSSTSSIQLNPTTSADSPVTQTDSFTVPNTVSPGTYNLVLTVVDPAGYFNPMRLADQGRAADGSYTLGQMQVQ